VRCSSLTRRTTRSARSDRRDNRSAAPRGGEKYRKKIGLDVELEALREVWRDRLATMDEIDHYARIRRVELAMSPYLESLMT